jgi:hypothetical protein
MEQQEIFIILQAILECIEKNPDGDNNKKWFTKLIQCSLNGQNCPETDLDLIYNATIIEQILATILAIDIKTIVKIRMVQKVIITMWDENKWDSNLLNNYIYEEKPVPLNNIQINNEIPNHNETYIQEQPSLNPHNNITIPLEETNIEEVVMFENNENSKIPPNSLITNNLPEELSHNVIGGKINDIKHYDIRNRKFDPTNPFYITKGKNFRLGVLSVNTPGDNKKEQLLFVTNTLKLPKNSDLIKFEFHEGNSWITMGFDYEDDLNFCKDKLNSKDKEILKLIQLSTDKGKKKVQQTTIKDNISNNNQLPQKQKQISTNTKNTNFTKQKRILSKITQEDTNNKTNNKIGIQKNENFKTTNLSTQDPNNNPYNITEEITPYQGGFLTSEIPGKNRKDQLDYISKILKIPSDSNLITHIFYEGSSWISIFFTDPNKLRKCLNSINDQSNNIVNMIMLNNKNKNKEFSKKIKEKEFETIKHLNPSQTYQITDIPNDYTSNRIKGALKPFGKITDFKTIETKLKTKEKTIQVTIEPLPYSKDISNRWSIPLGSIMARIAPANSNFQIWKDRNQYTARLYGIPKNTNTVILMRSIKNLKPKTCYIPKCSISGKERSFAIISFQNKTDLDKACSSRAKYLDFSLKWSKSRIHHTYSTSIKNQMFSWDQTKFKDSDTDNEIDNCNSDNESQYQFSNPSTSPESTSSFAKFNNTQKTNKQFRGKRRQNHHTISKTQENNTTDKLTTLISQIAFRLDLIENKMGIRPNRS